MSLVRHFVAPAAASLLCAFTLGCPPARVTPEYSLPPGQVIDTCSDSNLDAATTLVTDSNVSPALVVTGSTLVWIDRGQNVTDSIQTLDISGDVDARRGTLYSASQGDGAIEDLVTDGTNIYFAAVTGDIGTYTSTIQSIPIGGGEAKVLATLSTDILNIGVAGHGLYFSDGTSLYTVPKEGGSPALLDNEEGGLVTNGSAVYWTDADGNLVTIPAPAEPTVVLIQNQVVSDNQTLIPTLVANDTAVFWPCQDDESGLLCSAAVKGGGGVTRVVATLGGQASQLAVDDENVYFIDTGTCTSALRRVPVAGGPATTLASGFGVGSELSNAHAIALDDTYVYWTTTSGILRQPK